MAFCSIYPRASSRRVTNLLLSITSLKIILLTLLSYLPGANELKIVRNVLWRTNQLTLDSFPVFVINKHICCLFHHYGWIEGTKYSALSIYRGHFSLHNSRKTSRSSPVRARYGVSFVTAKFDRSFLQLNCWALCTIILYMTTLYRESIVPKATCVITVTSHERHGFTNNRQIDCMFSSFFVYARNTKKHKKTSHHWSLEAESTTDGWVFLPKGQ